jgi:acyl-CoA synthetase (AMP-forming)/AMP-acid ligase II
MPPADTTISTAETLAGFVERQAQRRPDGIAIRYGDLPWSWADWASRIRRVAGALRAAGVQRGQCVAFLDKNHPACLEVLFAAASMGAVTTIVNWRVIVDELVHVLDDCGARLLCVGAELWPTVWSVASRVARLERIVVVGDTPGTGDEYESLLAAASPAPPDTEVADSDTALVIYSSGTTGRPKGVLLGQRALVNHSANLAPAFPFAEGDANLVAMPLGHSRSRRPRPRGHAGRARRARREAALSRAGLGVLTRCFSESVDQFLEVTAVAAVYAFAQIHHARAPLAAE